MRRLLISACALRFLDSFILIAPFYTVMFAEKGLTPAQIGMALASWSVVGVILEVPCGVLADRVSRRWVLCVAQLLRCAGFAVWMAVPTFWGFLAGLMLWGMKSASLSGAFEAVIYDELKAEGREDEYAKVFGRTQSARFAGVLAASLVAAAASGIGYDAMILASILSGVAAAGSALALPAAPRARIVGDVSWFGHLLEGARHAARLPGVPHLILFIAGMQAIVYACADYWQLYAREVGLPRPAIALFVAAIYGVGAVTAALAHRTSRLPLPLMGLVLAAAGSALIAGAAIWTTWSIVLPIVFVSLYWLVEVAADARFQHAIRPETRATVASVKGFAMQTGTSVLMLLFGLIAGAASYRVAFLAAGVAAIAWGLVHAASFQARARSSTNLA